MLLIIIYFKGIEDTYSVCNDTPILFSPISQHNSELSIIPMTEVYMAQVYVQNIFSTIKKTKLMKHFRTQHIQVMKSIKHQN